MAVVLNSLFEVKISYQANEQECMNVLHYRNDTDLAFPVFPDDVQAAFLEEFGGSGNGEFPGEFLKVMSNAVTITRLSCQMVFPVRWRATVLELSILGGINSPCHTQNIQWTGSKYGTQAVRSEIGSMHVGGMSEDSMDSGEMTAAHKTRANTLLTFLGTTLFLADPVVGLVPAIANKVKVANSDPPRYKFSGGTPISQWVRRDTLRTQRTRTKGNGI